MKDHGPPDGNSRRKPDAGITSLAAAQRVSESNNIDLGWDELVERQAPFPPFQPFKWKYHLSYQEFKRWKQKLEPPPASYANAERPPLVPHKTNVREKVAALERNEVSTPQRQKGDPGGKRKRQEDDPSIIFSLANPTCN